MRGTDFMEIDLGQNISRLDSGKHGAGSAKISDKRLARVSNNTLFY